MKQHKTEAIILKTTDVFDADRSLLLFSREFGKIRARAKGVRKPTSKLTGHLLVYLPTSLELLETGSNYLIIQAQVVSEYIQETVYPENALLFGRQAGVIAETLNKMYPENESHKEVYEGLLYTLDRLRAICTGSVREEKAALVTGEFLLKALSVLGYSPQLTECVVTGEPIQEQFIAWNSQLGGVLSENGWIESGRQGIVLDHPQSLIVLRQLLKDVFMAERIAMSEDVRQEACQILYDYVQTQIGQPLKALS